MGPGDENTSLIRMGRHAYPINLLSLLVFCIFANVAVGAAFESRVFPEFVEVRAIQPRPDGGFGFVGFMRADGGGVQSAFWQVDAKGMPVRAPVILPGPDAKHPQVWVASLLALPSGEYIAAGWAEDLRGKPDAWVIRFTSLGDIIWNTVITSDADQRLYSVKLLSDGRVIAVGRTQEGTDARQHSSGYAVSIDADNNGELDGQQTYTFSQETVRSGFQDFAELTDGSLVFTGWTTRREGNDDIWILKARSDGAVAKSIAFGEASNDVAFAVLSSGDEITVGGVLRAARDQPKGVVATFDSSLTRKTALDLGRMLVGTSQVRAIYQVPSSRQIIVVGETTKPGTPDVTAFASIANAQGVLRNLGDFRPQPGPSSSFEAIAVDSYGTLAIGGWTAAGKDLPRKGFIAFGTNAIGCDVDDKGLADVAAAIAARSPRVYAVCARKNKTTQIKITADVDGFGILVRPTVGDVDVMLKGGGDVLDVSLNANHAPQLLVPPANAGTIDLYVSTRNELAVFTIGAVKIGGSPIAGSGAEGPITADKNVAATLSLKWLGFDVVAPETGHAPTATVVDQRAVMAFQAGEGFTPTGALSQDQYDRLTEKAARRIDSQALARAQDAAAAAAGTLETSFDVPGNPPVNGQENGPLKSITSVVRDGRVLGVGTFDFGTFSGEWSDLEDAAASMRPALGVLTLGNGCKISLRGINLTGSALDLFNSSIGVVRSNREIVFAGSLKTLWDATPFEADGKTKTPDKLCRRH